MSGDVSVVIESSYRIRRFSPEEDQQIAEQYLAYVPIATIARDLDRLEGVVRQRIHRLGLQRSPAIVLLMRWAPEHLKSQQPDVPEREWIAAVYAWRAQQRKDEADAKAEDVERAHAERIARSAEIDADDDLDRNQKMKAKRLAGLTLEEIGEQYHLSRERVRQITDRVYEQQPVSERLARLEQAYAARRARIIASTVAKLLDRYRAAPPEAQQQFRALILRGDDA